MPISPEAMAAANVAASRLETSGRDAALSRSIRTFAQFVMVGAMVDVLPYVILALEDDGPPISASRLIRAGIRAVAGALLAWLMRPSLGVSVSTVRALTHRRN
jgi:hypothetical protein